MIRWKKDDGSTYYWSPYRWLDAPWLRVRLSSSPGKHSIYLQDAEAYFRQLDEMENGNQEEMEVVVVGREEVVEGVEQEEVEDTV